MDNGNNEIIFEPDLDLEWWVDQSDFEIVFEGEELGGEEDKED